MKKTLLRIVKNKYVLVVLVFLVFFFFIDDNSVVTTIRLRGKLKELRKKEFYYIQQCESDSLSVVRLKRDVNFIEKYGREKYYMKRDNEDVFIISKPGE